MRRSTAVLAFVLAFALEGCFLSRKPKIAATPAPPKPAVTAPAPAPAPPEPLSTPQTQVQLPPPQPVNPDALATAPPQLPPETTRPAPRPRRPSPPPQPRTETQQPDTPAQQAEPERPPVQAIVPAEDLRRFQESAQARKREVRQLLAQAQRRNLNASQMDTRSRVEGFLKQSDDAEQRGDMRQADALAERAQVLARGLIGGR